MQAKVELKELKDRLSLVFKARPNLFRSQQFFSNK